MMKDKVWIHEFLIDTPYTKEDVHHIVGERPLFKPDRMKEDLDKILGSMPGASASCGSGAKYR